MLYNTDGNASGHHPSSSTAPRNPILYPLHHHLYHHHHPIMIPLPPPPSPSPSLPPFSGGSGGGGGGGSDYDEIPRRDERFPQWSNQETRDFIEIRAQLEWDFTTAKRNKNLWEMVASRLREKGFRRTSDQCKCKWKNLVNRYKGQEASDVENGRKCPFFDELHAVFTARDNKMLQAQFDSETGLMKGKKRLKNVSEDQSFEDFSEEEYDEEETDIDHTGTAKVAPKSKAGSAKRQKMEKRTGQSNTNVDNKDSILNSLQDILKNFFKQQLVIDTQWRELMEKSAKEKEMFEQEWRQTMEKLERERITMERAWREREERRRMREESRAEERDALLTTLLNKLIRDEKP